MLKEIWNVMIKKKHIITVLAVSVLVAIDLLIMLLPLQSLLILKHRGFAKSSDGKSVDFSGTYTFNKQSSRGHYSLGNPFVAVSMISDGSKVVIQQESDSKILVVSNWDNGNVSKNEFNLSSKTFDWHQGSLLFRWDIPPVGPPMLPAIGKQTRTGIVSLDNQGNMTIASIFVERGLILFFIPFVEYDEYCIVLRKKIETE